MAQEEQMTSMSTSRSTTCTLRPARPEDDSFFFRLFAESQEQLALLRSNEVLWQSLVEMQYRGRKISYATAFPEACDSVLCLDDGDGHSSPVGRLLVDRKAHRWRIVDISVLREHRGRGLGRMALKECQAQCKDAEAKLELEVTPQNPAGRLYRRLGFRVTGEDLLAVRMEWNAAEYGTQGRRKMPKNGD
jgi:ribosomal protein S18 acetylase RimI-like enzyme